MLGQRHLLATSSTTLRPRAYCLDVSRSFFLSLFVGLNMVSVAVWLHPKKPEHDQSNKRQGSSRAGVLDGEFRDACISCGWCELLFTGLVFVCDMVRGTTVGACLGVRDPPHLQLMAWFAFHRRVGVSHFFVHLDGASHSSIVQLKEEDVTLLPASHFAWRDDVDIIPGFRSRFVGQTDFLMRCVAAASSVIVGWLANLDFDEYLMPSPPHLQLSSALDAAAKAAAAPMGVPAATSICISIRRHNFYAPDVERMNHSEEGSQIPVSSRLLRAPFPPDGRVTYQPFLPKWVTRVPASAGLVVNMHEVWHSDLCRHQCVRAAGQGFTTDNPGAPIAARANAAEAAGASTAETDLRADPAGLGSIAMLAQADARVTGGISLPLVASLVTPLGFHCPAPPAESDRCVLNPRSINVTASGFLRHQLLQCLSAGAAANLTAGPAAGMRMAANQQQRRHTVDALEPWCWRPACTVRGDAAERHVRINHYGHPPLPEQRHGYDLARVGEAMRDTFALRFIPGS